MLSGDKRVMRISCPLLTSTPFKESVGVFTVNCRLLAERPRSGVTGDWKYCRLLSYARRRA